MASSFTPKSIEIDWDKPILPVGNPQKGCTVIIGSISMSRWWFPDGSLRNSYDSIGSGTYYPQTRILDGKKTVVNSYPRRENDGTYDSPNLSFRWQFAMSLGVEIGTLLLPNGTANNVTWSGVSGIESKVYAYLNSLVTNRSNSLGTSKTTYRIIYSTCGVPASTDFPSFSPTLIYLGTAAPPPPPGKNMCGCDCNTIATIIEERLAGQNKQVKDHVDQRTIEQLKSINKMLQGMTIDLDLQPVIDRLNEVETNLWNGPKLGG